MLSYTRLLVLRPLQLLLPLAFLIQFSACQTGSSWNGEGFLVEAELESISGGHAVLVTYEDGERVVVDSVPIASGTFSLTGTSEDASMHYLHLDDREEPLLLFLENERFRLSGDADSLPSIRVRGGSAHALYSEYVTESERYSLNASRLEEEYEAAMQVADSVTMERIERDFDALSDEQATSVREFTRTNSDDPVAGYVALTNLYRFDYADLRELTDMLKEKHPQHKYTLSLSDYVTQLAMTQIGEIAPDFGLPTPQGDTLQLSDLRGSYLLVDFWASWCGPCRVENPNIVAAYTIFKERGFDILGVSLDRVQNRWAAAIEEDQLDWYHVSDLKGWDSAAGELYGVRSIPFSLLLDPEGVIVARNLKGEELHELLTDLLGDAG